MKPITFQTYHPTILPSPISPNTSKMVFFFPFNHKTSHSLTHCTTKPDTNLGPSTGNEPAQLIHQEVPNPTWAVDSSSGLVLDLGIKDSWDSAQVGSPVVKRFLTDHQERWHMWYHGRTSYDQTDSIGLAISCNGVHWERGQSPAGSGTGLGRVMGPGEDWWAFDIKSVRPSEVIVMSSSKLRPSDAVYWLYYTGFSSQEIDFDPLDESQSQLQLQLQSFVSLPGLAISQDGRHWAKIEGQDHSGSLLGLGLVGEWDSLYIASPHVVFHDRRDIRMYYHSFDPDTRRFCIGMARSRDGIEWVKLGRIGLGEEACGFDELGVMSPCVVRNKDGSYLMAYEGVGPGGGRCIGLAGSSDGLKEWRRLGDGPVLEPSVGGGWDCEGVGSPCLVEMEGSEDEKWRLYYRGVGVGGKSGIGMAVCDGVGGEGFSFKRWVVFRV